MFSTLRFTVPTRTRAGLVSAVSAAFALLCGGWLVVARSDQGPAPASTSGRKAAAADARFRPTDAQWSNMKVQTVAPVRFDAALIVEGTIASNEDTTAAVYSPFSGRVIDIRAQLGQVVRAGERLATILAAEAAQSDSDLGAATSAEAVAARQLSVATAAETRQHELFIAEAGTQKDWLQAQTDLLVAQNAQRAARAALNAVRTKASILGGASSGLGTDAGRGQVTAPIGGVVVQRQVSPGQYVGSMGGGAGGPMFTIVDLRTVWVLASVNEADVGGLAVGQAVEVTVLAMPQQPFRSRIAWVSSAIDPATHRATVRAELANPGFVLKPQMSATVRLLKAGAEDVVAIARSAVVYDGDQAHCYVVDADRGLSVRSVQLGRSQGPMIEVRAGLKAGERIVTRGALFIDQAADDAKS